MACTTLRILIVSLSAMVAFVAAKANVINVKNAPYNAKGDGIADDTSALQNAINACPNVGTVYFPSGTYKLSSSLVLVNSCTYQGQEASTTVLTGYTGTGQAAFALFYSYSLHDVTITGLTLNGGGLELDGPDFRTQTTPAVYNITFSDNTITNIVNTLGNEGDGTSSVNGIDSLSYASNVTITNSFFSHIGYGGNPDNSGNNRYFGIAVNTIDRFHVNNNVFDYVDQGFKAWETWGLVPTGISQDDNEFNNNTLTHLHSMVYENQASGLTHTQINNNVASSWVNNYWGSWGISFPGNENDPTAIARGNTLDFTNANNIVGGICIEWWNSGTVDSNVCKTEGSNNAQEFEIGLSVGGTPSMSLTISNNRFCGPQPYYVNWSSCSGSFQPLYMVWDCSIGNPNATFINNTYSTSCQ